MGSRLRCTQLAQGRGGGSRSSRGYTWHGAVAHQEHLFRGIGLLVVQVGGQGGVSLRGILVSGGGLEGGREVGPILTGWRCWVLVALGRPRGIWVEMVAGVAELIETNVGLKLTIVC